MIPADQNLSIACKDEYYRRLRAYNEWKERNLSAKGLLQKKDENTIESKGFQHLI